METKIPKPSGLNRALPTIRPMVPMDRIKAPTFSGCSLSSGSGTNKDTQCTLINSRNCEFLNTNSFNRKPPVTYSKERCISPDVTRCLTNKARIKLRRSRSACDLRDLNKPFKRHEPTLATIPAKITRMGVTTANTSNNSNNCPLNSRPPRIGINANINSSVTVRRPITIASIKPKANNEQMKTTKTNNLTSSMHINKKLHNNTKGSITSTATTGAGKTINKRIPPYDYKARYNDLLEKHQMLKQKYQGKCEQMGNLENLPEQLEDTQAQLEAAAKELKNTQINNENLIREVNTMQQQVESIAQSLTKTSDELAKLKKEYNKIKYEHGNLSIEVLELRERSSKLAEHNNQLIEDITTCKEQLFRSNMERKELHNTVMDLRGNIRVFCRVRPPLDIEKDKIMCGWNYIDEATVEIISNDPLVKHKANSHCFSFDQVFHPCSRQEDIFELVSPLIQSALDGYNICIFAYGQTGSGKTYTMDGTSENLGVIPRTVDLLFDAIKAYRNLGWVYEIRVQFLEIYNETLYDLLSNEPKEMEIRMVKNSKTDIYVSNITQEVVENEQRLRDLMYIAKANRATAATVGNERSSRSHAVTKIELIGTHEDKHETSTGSINLVDLAGSESPKTSIRMNETKNINRSLSELTNVIIALLQKQDHIPYRNSKLTHLLMPSLGGNSKTLMFINVAPFQDCFQESLKSLRFAYSVNQCKMAKAKRNRGVYTPLSNPSGLNGSNSLEK